MDELNFTLEMKAEGIIDDELENALFNQADEELRALANDHDDMTGAAISIDIPAHGETPPLFEVTIVVYMRPENIAATKKTPDVTGAFNEAMQAIERQVHEERNKRKKHWERPEGDPVVREVLEVTAAEERKQLMD